MNVRLEKITNKKTIKKILEIYNCDFTDSIESRVGDLDEYAIKIAKYAETYIAIENDKMVGCIIFYCNNINEKIAYIASVSVDKEYRGQGVGSNLMEICCEISYKRGMNQLKLEVDIRNDKAIKFYKKSGFIDKCKCSDNTIYMVKELK